jgi:hypothetical protein
VQHPAVVVLFALYTHQHYRYHVLYSLLPLPIAVPHLQPGGAWEDKSQWLARMSKMLCTFCVIMIQPEQQPVSLADAWAWLANIVNISTPVPSATMGDKGRFLQNEWLCEVCVLCEEPLSRLLSISWATIAGQTCCNICVVQWFLLCLPHNTVHL